MFIDSFDKLNILVYIKESFSKNQDFRQFGHVGQIRYFGYVQNIHTLLTMV